MVFCPVRNIHKEKMPPYRECGGASLTGKEFRAFYC